MRFREFRELLFQRARKADVSVPEEAIAGLDAYFALLAKWNETINLTGLPLSPPTDDTFDRLLIEPLAAARHVRTEPLTWFDLGSGGGSPAIPLKIVRPAAALTMVESKTRKAAFLREAVRTLSLSEASVLTTRVEAIPDERLGKADLVTIRAVRIEATVGETAARLLGDEGELMIFGRSGTAARIRAFSLVDTTELFAEAQVARYRRVSRGTKPLT